MFEVLATIKFELNRESTFFPAFTVVRLVQQTDHPVEFHNPQNDFSTCPNSAVMVRCDIAQQPEYIHLFI